jgi:hypothetical protein
MKVDDNNQHAQFIQNIPKFIAYSEHEPWFLEFDHLPQLEQEIYDIASNPTALHHKSTPTCALALIESEIGSIIHELCQFRDKTVRGYP